MASAGTQMWACMLETLELQAALHLLNGRECSNDKEPSGLTSLFHHARTQLQKPYGHRLQKQDFNKDSQTGQASLPTE